MDGERHIERLNQARRALLAVGRRIRLIEISRLLTIGSTIFLAALIAAALGDFLIRFPGPVRFVQLVAWLAVGAWAARRWLLPAMRFQPTVTQLALRVEEQHPELRGSLASALELAEQPPADAPGRQLFDKLASQVVERLDSHQVSSGVDIKPSRRAVGWLALPSVLAITLSLMNPGLAWTGVNRVLAPWADAAWPKRTALADMTNTAAHPAGVALPLRAALVRTHRAIGETPVRVHHRVRRADGSTGPVRSVWLTFQGTDSEQTSHERYETLIETGGYFAEATSEGPASIEYWFETEDDRTSTTRVAIVPPPEVESARLVLTPPTYAVHLDGRWQEGSHDLGAGLDDRAVVGPLLAGSQASLTIETTKPVTESGSMLIALEDGSVLEATVTESSREWTSTWVLTESETLRVSLTDEFGIESRERPAFRFEVLADEPASATVLAPERDEAVTPNAVVSLEAEGRDDVGLALVAIEIQPWRSSPDSESGTADQPGEATVLERWTNDPAAASKLAHRVRSTLELESLELAAGDEIKIVSLARDMFEDAAGTPREPTRSMPRVLRIIDESELIDEVLAELGAVRRGAIRLDGEQNSISRRLDRRAPTRTDVREQSSLQEGIASLGEIVENVASRLDRNNLNDELMRGLLEDAQATAEAAEQAAQRATEATDRGANAATAEEQQEAQRDAQREQERVREELERLAGLLDRGQDSWAVRRSLERLLESQAEISQQTQQAGAVTQGRDMASLTPDERDTLDKIADRQFELAEEAESLLDELERRAEQMDEFDPGQAAAMRAAARRGRDAELDQQLQQASEQVGQNQTSQASQSQQRAREALGEMMRDLDDAARQRDEQLQRLLASLLESLEGLIRQQTGEIDLLVQSQPGDEPAALVSGMTAMHRNTLGAIDDVAQELAALGQVRSVMLLAADEQVDAIRHLRAQPPALEAAETAERASLAALEEARTLAEEAQREAQNREADRARKELRERYETLLEEQVSLRAETEPLVGQRLTRRTRATARALGQRQEQLSDRIESTRDEFPDVRESQLFSLAHDRLAMVTSRSADSLRAGEAPRRVLIDQSSSIRLLQGLIDALDEQQDEEEFRESNNSSGGEGQGGEQPQPVIPPIAELKALRVLQQEAYELTRLASDGVEGISIEEAGDLQLEVAERGQAAIEALAPGQSGAPPQTQEPETEEEPTPVIPEGEI